MRAPAVLRLLFCLLFINIGYCFSAANAATGSDMEFTQGISIPLFPAAKDLWGGPQDAEINAIPIKMAGLSTDRLLGEIFSFYQTRLPELGWQMEMALPWLNVIFFSKQGNFFYVVGSGPLRGVEAGTTRFVLILAQKEVHLCVNFQVILGPNPQDTPGKDFGFIPRYPGSIRATSITKQEREGFFIYLSKDFARKITEFYYNNLPRYGWSINREDQGFYPLQSIGRAPFALHFRRRERDRLSIYVTFCQAIQVNVIIISYNHVFNDMIWTVNSTAW